MFQFRGVSSLNVDAKGRIAVPARYRDQLKQTCGGCLVATLAVTGDRCLWIYPEPEWEIAERDIMAVPNLDDEVRRIQRVFTGYASECELDGQGRIRLDSSLRERIGLNKSAVLVGQRKKFELWHAQTWEAESDIWTQGAGEGVVMPEALRSIIF